MTHYKWKRIVRESMPPLLIALVFSLASGIFLNSTLKLKELIAILLVLPAFINIGGDIAGVVSARITTSMYMGEDKTMWTSIIGGLIVSLVLFAFLGIIAEILLEVMGGGIGIEKFISITLLAGMMATTTLLGISLSLELLGRKFGMDPSDLSIPLLSAIGDAIGVWFLIFTAKIIMGV